MAPEQAAGQTRQLTTAADVYSLGAILYELLAGRPPFQGATPLETLRQVVEEEPVPPSRSADASFARTSKPPHADEASALRRPVDRDLETICLKCLDKDPRARYGSAEALAEDLERWLRHEPVRARRAGPWERLAKWSRRHPAVAGVSAGALLIFLAGLAGVLWQWRRAELNDRQSRVRLVRLNVANGVRQLNEGDHFGALLWFTEALPLDRGDPQRVANHRVRVESLIEQSPRLAQMWFPGGRVYQAEISPDGRWLVTSQMTNGVRVWSTATGQPLTPHITHEGQGGLARFHAGGRWILVRANGSPRLYEPDTGQWVKTLLPGQAQGTYDLSPDGRWVAEVRNFRNIQIRDAATGELSKSFQAGFAVDDPGDLGFSPDSRYLFARAYGNRSPVQMWDVATGQALPLPSDLPAGTRYAGFSPDSRRLITADEQGVARLWDIPTGRPVTPPLTHTRWLVRADVSPDGKLVATSGSEGLAKIWNAQTGELLRQLSAHSQPVLNSVFSPDSTRLLTRGFDGVVRVWDIATGRPLSPPLRHAGPINVAGFHPDGQRVFTAGEDGTVRLWDISSDATRSSRREEAQNEIAELERSLHASSATVLDVSPSGARLIMRGAGQLTVWDTTRWKPTSPVIAVSQAVDYAALSRDEARLLLGVFQRENDSPQWRLETWSPATGKLLHTATVPTGATNLIRASPDCAQVLVSSGRRAEVFDAATGRALAPPLEHTNRVRQTAFSPDARFIATAADDTARVWDAATGQPLTPPMLHRDAPWDRFPIASLTFSPDGRRLLVACTSERELAARHAQVWDARAGQPVTPRLKHGDGVLHAAFSADGRAVLTASEDATARVWDARTGQPLTPPLPHKSFVNHAAFSPDGRRVATASQDATARVWDALTGEPLTPPLSHDSPVKEVFFLGDGRYLLARTGSGDKLWRLPREHRPIEELVSWARLLAGHRLDATGTLAPLDFGTLSNAWTTLRAGF
jgi:WD40 repeat protein